MVFLELSIAGNEDRLEELAVEAANIELPDRSVIINQINRAADHNARVKELEQYVQVKKELDYQHNYTAGLTMRLDALLAQKADLLPNTEMPIEGLSFEEDYVLYQGIPFRKCSASEQLRVSLAMAMALNPTLKVIRVLDASLLDSDNMQVIRDMAKQHDYQVWLEVVADAPGLGVYIEDGMVSQ